ncbi:large conductance mechanosensitive channel protein MscL [Sulfobacillus harzensis]|uniref:Large-conductance mechanosensitive channel n=1 Tax=Sulfobacillus harzensis TaxID=2729629 RepID=A0A7Y0L4S6_9FIRM|nr:large conductance mechanosensitive channel protein MscL [Sulfobacillus harzensis]NMP23286.1 large conductance mechanosensitive channel protein MscL [Sulfobacillus harzensis]
MWNDFKTFVARGNVMDLAIALVVGTAFTKIVSTLVNNVIMPPIGLLLGRVDFSSLYINLSSHQYSSYSQAAAAGAPVIAYGLFLNTIIDFVIVAILMFFVVRWINRLKGPAPTPAPTTQTCPFCKTSIALDATRCPYCTSHLDTTP